MGFDAFANLSGFAQYFGKTEYNNDDDFDGYWGIWDEPFLQFYAKKMNSFRQPFFTTLFTVSSHHPYHLPEGYENKFKGGPKLVHRTIEYTDYALKKFFQSARAMPWFNNTLFVITADHASAEIQVPEYNSAWGYFSIPIFFYHPGENGGGLRPEIVQQIDIMPSILGYLHYEKPYVAFGRDVFNDPTRPFAFNYLNNVYQIFRGDYLLQFDGSKAVALYQFKNDKTLKNNLVNQLPDTTISMTASLKAFIQQYNNRMVDNNLTVDGVDNNFMMMNSPGLSPPMDALQEFRVATNNSAEYGRSAGANVNMVIRSGSRDLHGSAYEYFRNNVLDANDFFANRQGSGKVHEHKDPLHMASFDATAEVYRQTGPLAFPEAGDAFRRTVGSRS